MTTMERPPSRHARTVFDVDSVIAAGVAESNAELARVHEPATLLDGDTTAQPA